MAVAGVIVQGFSSGLHWPGQTRGRCPWRAGTQSTACNRYLVCQSEHYKHTLTFFFSTQYAGTYPVNASKALNCAAWWGTVIVREEPHGARVAAVRQTGNPIMHFRISANRLHWPGPPTRRRALPNFPRACPPGSVAAVWGNEGTILTGCLRKSRW